jgi:HAD superfamily hydrolase (TIGR01509 family)
MPVTREPTGAQKPPRFTPPDRSNAGYIFDCDGTLVESMPLHFEAWRAAFEQHLAPFDFGWELFTSRAGMPLDTTVVELNLQFAANLDPVSVVRVQRQRYRELLGRVVGIEPVIAFARQVAQSAPVSVASGGHRYEVETSLQNVGLRDLFPCVMTSTDVTRGKPDPEILLRCADAMNVAPADCLVIEDGELGIEAAERANMAWVRVEAASPPQA